MVDAELQCSLLGEHFKVQDGVIGHIVILYQHPVSVSTVSLLLTVILIVIFITSELLVTSGFQCDRRRHLERLGSAIALNCRCFMSCYDR